MNAEQVTTLGVIIAIFTSLIGVYYLARSSARENARAQETKTQTAVDEAKKPLQDALASAQRTLDRRDATIAARDARIDQLEDELRRGRT